MNQPRRTDCKCPPYLLKLPSILPQHDRNYHSRALLTVNLPGDLRVLHAARQTARQNFDSNFSLSASSAEAVAGIAHAEDVAQVLRRHVVQGERVGEEAVDQGGRYRRFFPLAKKIR